MKRPLLGLTIAFAVGILAGAQIHYPPLWLAAVTLMLLIAFLLTARRRWSAVVMWMAILSAGATAYRFSIANASPIDITKLVIARDQNISLRGVIVSDPGFREAEGADAEIPATDRHSFKLDLEALRRAGDWEPATGRVLMFIDAEHRELLRYGDEIECSAVLRVPAPATNPGLFDWKAWLARQHIHFTASIRKGDDCRQLAIGRGNPILALSLRLREYCEQALRLGLEHDPELAGVLAAIVIGERSEIPVETYTNFQQTGVFHVFATAGLHVGIVTWMVVMILRLLQIPRRWCALVAIPLLILYVFVTGSRPCAVRALVMASVWLIGWLLVRPVDALTTLAAAAMALLLWEPAEMFDSAFALSFSVVLALVLLTPPLEKWLLAWWEPDPFLPKELLPKWRTGLDQPLRWVMKSPSCSLATWIGLLPLMALYFNLFIPISILANLFVIPLVGLIIPIGMMGALLYSICPAVTLIANNANFALLNFMINLVNWFGHWSPGHIFVQAPSLGVTIGYYAILFVLISSKLTPRWKYWIAGVAASGLLLLLIIRHFTAPVEVTVLNLSDGTAVVVTIPQTGQAFLIDGGGEWSGERVVLPFLHSHGVNRLDAVAVTHADKAHVGGLTKLTQQMPIRQVWQGEASSRSKFAQDWQETVRKCNLPLVTLQAGDERIIGGKLHLKVLNPSRGSDATRSDDNCLVLLLENGSTRVLLASDIGRSVEQRLVAAGAVPPAQIIIKGRHGKEASGTTAFLNTVKPAVVIQSVITHPGSPPFELGLHERLRERGGRLYRTDENGAVTVLLKETGYEIQTCLAAGARLGNEHE